MNIEPICFVFMFINVIARKIFAKNRLRLIMYYELMRIMYSKVWLDGDSLCAWSFVITSLSYKENFSFLYRMVLFLSSLGLFFSFSFSFFLPRTFFRSWFFREQRFFHKQRTSTSEFLKCAMQTKYGITCKLKSSLNVSGCRDTSPEDSPRSEIMTPSWFIIFHLKIRFSK